MSDLVRNETLFGRKRTLVKYDRHVELHRAPSISKSVPLNSNSSTRPSAWGVFSRIITLLIPGFLMTCCGIKGIGPQQAWREKVTLCFIVLCLSTFVAFFLLFYNDIACPASQLSGFIPIDATGGVIVRGVMYNAALATPLFNTQLSPTGSRGGVDVSQQFTQPLLPSCDGITERFATLQNTCEIARSCLDLEQLREPNGGIYGLIPFTILSDNKTVVNPLAVYEWGDLLKRGLVAYKNSALNLNTYVQSVPVDRSSSIDSLIRQAHKILDATLLLTHNSNIFTPRIERCFIEKFSVGALSILPPQCVLSRILTMLTLVIVLGIILSRFLLAVTFDWIISERLARKPKNNTANKSTFQNNSATTLSSDPLDLFTVFLVTCYSEGQDSLQSTFDSLVETDYPDEKKLLFIIADGIITGKGNSKSTPELILDMLQLDSSYCHPEAHSYFAIASGQKMHNMAKVYTESKGHYVPAVVIVKCGAPEEQNTSTKPGNRGKRDSQLILMNFFSRVLTNDYMTPLDYELFKKITCVAGVTPDYYEIVLMVDADTRVHKSSLRYMVNAMNNDLMIVGLCGETKISNKSDSWVTCIQVFEYYISHHLGKAFESVFGMVTCLPGCFCMYRIKAKKNSNWIPLLVHPDIIEKYSICDVETLHQKNLLLLGEDRFLSTMLLSTFVKRKMIFVPKATCKTIVPEDFATLLSQRRRWINSTIHNQMELAQVRNLCGTFCLSMQFIVIMDLVGTAILPVGLLLTYYLIFKSIITKYDDWFSFVPTVLLAFVIFMPALLMMLTKLKISRLGWMLIYLLALPIWNFVLPVYAFWRFDDFSWGATRQVEGAHGIDDHRKQQGEKEFDRTIIPMKRWLDYETERRMILHNSLYTNPGSGYEIHFE